MVNGLMAEWIHVEWSMYITRSVPLVVSGSLKAPAMDHLVLSQDTALPKLSEERAV